VHETLSIFQCAIDASLEQRGCRYDNSKVRCVDIFDVPRPFVSAETMKQDKRNGRVQMERREGYKHKLTNDHGNSRFITGDAGSFSVTLTLGIRTSPINRTRNQDLLMLEASWAKDENAYNVNIVWHINYKT
jgi:hypothetical protein